MKSMRRAVATLKDRPGTASLLVLALVAAHVVAARRWPRFDTAGLVHDADELVSVYMGLAGVAALMAVLAGVLVVVFSTITGDEWSRVRELGGRSLTRNWASPIRSTLCASFLAVLSAILEQAGHGRLAWWTFEVAALVVVSAVIRILWLLNGLLRVQQDIDQAASQVRRRPSLANLQMPDTGASAPTRRSAAGLGA